MRILTYSDLHLEFGGDARLTPDPAGDVMILAGDIVALTDYAPLERVLRGWDRPVLYVTGNHEYYTRRPMSEENSRFENWLQANHPQVELLLDEGISIDGVHFFRGHDVDGLQRCR